MTSAGGDPFFKTGDLPEASGPYTLKMRFRTAILEDGQVFWSITNKPSFGTTRRVDFAIIRDGDWHEYTVNLPETHSITNLRIDPGKGKGVATFNWIRLLDKDGTTVRAWEFDQPVEE